MMLTEAQILQRRLRVVGLLAAASVKRAMESDEVAPLEARLLKIQAERMRVIADELDQARLRERAGFLRSVQAAGDDSFLSEEVLKS